MGRKQEVERLRRQLERLGFPRLRMLFIVLVTGFAGFMASYGLLHLGITSMPVRYELALLVAYVVFLLLARYWAASVHIVDEQGTVLDLLPDTGDCYDAASGLPDVSELIPGADLEVISFAAIVMLVVGLITVVASCLWVLYDAPVFFAELCLDSLLAAGLYRRLHRDERRHWLESAARYTWKPFLLVALALWMLGHGLHQRAPDAVTLGQALAELRSKH